jgi:hypothetical protein
VEDAKHGKGGKDDGGGTAARRSSEPRPVARSRPVVARSANAVAQDRRAG